MRISSFAEGLERGRLRFQLCPLADTQLRAGSAATGSRLSRAGARQALGTLRVRAGGSRGGELLREGLEGKRPWRKDQPLLPDRPHVKLQEIFGTVGLLGHKCAVRRCRPKTLE